MTVAPPPSRGARFPSWKPLYTYRDRVGFDLLLQPRRGADTGPTAVKVEMLRREGRWLVDTWYPAAVWSAPKERNWITGPADFTVGGSTSEWYTHEPVAQGRLDPAWLLVPAGLLGLVVAVPVLRAALTRRRRAY